jgi:DNA-binding SARP family transcriptional activator
MFAYPRASAAHNASLSEWPVLIRLFGSFNVLKRGVPIALRGGGKSESLLATLALRHSQRIPREVVLSEVWPEADPTLAGQALNSLVHSLHKLLGDALGGGPVVICTQGAYRLNSEAGIGVDIACFESLANAGDHQSRDGLTSAIGFYESAIELYQGDLRIAAADHYAVVERERLRAIYLTLLARAASHYYRQCDYETCQAFALRLLAQDPCREDACRLVMSCYVHRGERAQALRQYRLCSEILRAEFDVEPEPATTALFDRIRLDPSSI